MHGDDVLMSGPRSIVEKIRKSLKKRYETREQMISGREGEPKELAILNRKVRWIKERIRLAPDQRHMAEVIGELGVGASKPADTLVHWEMTEDEKVPLERAAASQFRRLAAKLNYLSWTGPTSGSGHRWFAPSPPPLVGDMIWLKRIAQFPVGNPVLWIYFETLYANTDVDWASCKESRRSMSGGMLVHNGVPDNQGVVDRAAGQGLGSTSTSDTYGCRLLGNCASLTCARFIRPATRPMS